MILLLDTNVVVDLLLQRGDCEGVRELMTLAIADKTIDCVTSTTVTDIHYLVGRYSNPKLDCFAVQDKIRDVLKIVDVLPVLRDDIENALNLRWEDMEDALQYSVAKSNGCDYIITSNVKDFKKSDIEVLTPAQFLEKYKSSQTTDGIVRS